MPDNVEARIAVLEKETAELKNRSAWRTVLSTILSILISSGVALCGSWLVFKSAEREREMKWTELREKELLALKAGYETKKHIVKTIFSLYGIDEVLKSEGLFRSGATVSALQEIRNAPSTCADKEEIQKEIRRKINCSLESVKGVMFIDSIKKDNVYCENSEKSSGTNIDDIVDIIKDFPIRIAGRKGDLDGPDQTLQDTLKARPDVIVMHLGAFEEYPRPKNKDEPSSKIAALKDDVSRVSEFLRSIYSARTMLRPSFSIHGTRTN